MVCMLKYFGFKTKHKSKFVRHYSHSVSIEESKVVVEAVLCFFTDLRSDFLQFFQITAKTEGRC